MTTSNFADIVLLPNTWTNIHTLLGLPVGTLLNYQNNGNSSIRAVTSVSEPTQIDNRFGFNVPAGGALFQAVPASLESLWMRRSGAFKAGRVGILPPEIAPLQSAGPPLNFELQLSRGLVPGMACVEKFGRNPSIDTTSDPEDVWNGGGLYPGFPTGAAETIDVSSSSAEDGAVGMTGLLTLRLFGQLAGVPQTEDVILNGTTKVTTVKLWDRMSRVRGLTAGSNGFNLGDITCQHTTTTANIFSIVPIGTNRSQIAAFTVEAGKTAHLKDFNPWITRANAAAGSAVVAIMAREPGGVWEQLLTSDISTSNSPPIDVHYTEKFPALTDIVVRVLSVTANGSSASAFMFLGLVDD